MKAENTNPHSTHVYIGADTIAASRRDLKINNIHKNPFIYYKLHVYY